MLDRQIEEEQLPYCHDKGMAVLAYSPLAQGLLTGKMRPDREFPAGDLRRNNERFSVENRTRVANMLEEMKPFAEARNITLTQLTIAWTVTQRGLTHALCGARNPDQAFENATAGNVQLSEDENERLNAIIARHSGDLV